jgi:hypothetical protein
VRYSRKAFPYIEMSCNSGSASPLYDGTAPHGLPQLRSRPNIARQDYPKSKGNEVLPSPVLRAGSLDARRQAELLAPFFDSAFQLHYWWRR